MSRKLHFISIHGFRGAVTQDYHMFLHDELGKAGYDVQIPALPHPHEPIEDEQVQAVLDQCTIDEHTVIIAHSLGCAVAMKLIMKLQKPFAGLVLVAPVVEPAFCTDPEQKKLIYWKGFDFTYDYDAVKRCADKIAVLSDMQEYDLRGPYARYLAKKLDAALYEFTAARRHISGYQEPKVLQVIEEIFL